MLSSAYEQTFAIGSKEECTVEKQNAIKAELMRRILEEAQTLSERKLRLLLAFLRGLK